MSGIWNTSLPRMYPFLVFFPYRFDHLWPALAIFGHPIMGLVSFPFSTIPRDPITSWEWYMEPKYYDEECEEVIGHPNHHLRVWLDA